MKNCPLRSITRQFVIGCAVAIAGQAMCQSAHIDSLNRDLKAAKTDSARITLMAEIGIAYAMPMPDTGRVYFQRALDLTDSALVDAPKNRYLRFARANLLNYIAAYHINRGEISKGLVLLREALVIREAIADSMGMAQSYNNLAMINFRAGRNPQAVDLLYRSLRISTAIRDSNAMAYNYNNIGQVLSTANELEKAGEAFAKSLALRRSIGEKKALRESLTSMAQYRRQTGQPAAALALLHEALELAAGFGDSLGVSKTLEGLAITMEALDSLTRAMAYTQRALVINKKLGLQELASNNLMNMAGYVHRMGRSEEALHLAHEGVAVAERLGAIKNMRNGYSLLAKLYKAKNDFISAYHYKARFAQVKDSLARLDNQQFLVKSSMRFEQDQEFLIDSLSRATETARTKNENGIARLTTAKRQNTSRAVAGAGALMLLTGATAFALDRRRRKHSHARKAALLETHAWRAQVNPQFIQTALNNINDYVQANERDLASAFLTRFARLMRAVLENARQEEVTLQSDLNVLRDYLELERARTSNRFSYTIEVDAAIDPEDVMVPPMLLQPFAENAIWAGLAKKVGEGHLVINIRKQGDVLTMLVQDDGGARTPGMPTGAPINEGPGGEMGMEITRSRLSLLAQQQHKPAGVRTGDAPQGRTVTMELPLMTAA
ncbi:MAG: tetratricopeptide repeat protein [Flavobacteriales bacterium]